MGSDMATEHTISEKLYADDWIALWHADALDLDFIDDNSVDLVVTSPRYNIGKKTGKGRKLWGGVSYGENSDDTPENVYQQEQIDLLNEIWRVVKPGRSLFYNHKVRNRNGQGIHPMQWILRSKWIFRQEIIWDRGSTHNFEMSYFWPKNELIFWLTKGQGQVFLTEEGARMGTIWHIQFQTKTKHPAPFPPELPARCIRAASKESELILDPCGGSMTTCKAAKLLKRQSIGVDINREYVVEAIKSCWQGVLL